MSIAFQTPEIQEWFYELLQHNKDCSPVGRIVELATRYKCLFSVLTPGAEAFAPMSTLYLTPDFMQAGSDFTRIAFYIVQEGHTGLSGLFLRDGSTWSVNT